MPEKRYFYDILSEFSAVREGNATVYTCPEAKTGHGYVPHGFDRINTSAADVMGWYGFRFCAETYVSDVTVTVTALLTDGEYRQTVTLAEEGAHEFDMRLCDFDCERAKAMVWRELTSVRVEFDGEATLVSARLVRGRSIYCDIAVRGLAGEVGDTLTYTVSVINCSEKTQTVLASQTVEGWESLVCAIEPRSAVIAQGERADFSVSVTLHDYMPVGSHEVSEVRFVPSEGGASAESVRLYSMRRHPHPMIYHTAEEWEGVREKIDKYEKFRPEYERMKRIADDWQVPPPIPFGERDYCYNTRVEEPLVFTAYMYRLTKDEAYAEKVAEFLRYFADPENGYPKRKKGCSQSSVQEGHFIAHIAMSYDMIYDSAVLSERDHERIKAALRIYVDIFGYGLASGHISNWVLSELSGALYCSVVLDDRERIERFVFGPTGIVEQLRYGAFDDGWWYECSLSYNTWVSSISLHAAHLMRRYGVDIINASFPIAYNKEVRPSHPKRPVKVYHAMVNQKWGGIRKGYITIKDLFDAPLKFLDYRGVMFGVNDSSERKLTGMHLGSTYDLAYRYYRDPAYLSVIATDPAPDPIFGIGELPELDEADAVYRHSAYSDNIGLVALRSNVAGRDAKDEIQAVLRYGSHGYAHGHFDRTELLSLMRYGRSFYNPEHVWWGYGHFMYKFYVQSSASKNMVTVDGKMQLPADSKRTLFYVGDGYSAAAVETAAAWAYPPFGGMIYSTGRDLAEQCEYNVSDLDSVTAAPHGEVTEHTEPIRQVRAMAVTDSYVVIFDRVEGEKVHKYDCLWQIKGFGGIEGDVKHIEHRAQKTKNVLSDAQFITDCDVYEVAGVSKASFVTKFGDGRDLRGTRLGYCEEGDLCMDVYTAWPSRSTQTTGLVAEDMGVRVPYDLTVTCGGREVHRHHANAWILGTRHIDVPLDGEGEIVVRIDNLPVYNEQMYPCVSSQGLFLADAVVEYDDGTSDRVAETELTFENIDTMHGIGKDQLGGYVLITGERYGDAIPVSPVDHDLPGFVTVAPSAGKRPVRLRAVVGVCAFPGDKEQRRVAYGVEAEGETARFVTVIEPHEGESTIASVVGVDENTVEVTLKNGRRDRVSVRGIEGDAPFVEYVKK